MCMKPSIKNEEKIDIFSDTQRLKGVHHLHSHYIIEDASEINKYKGRHCIEERTVAEIDSIYPDT